MRLLSFLADIERALNADAPAPFEGEGSWDNQRSVNYRQGIARLSLAAQKPGFTTSMSVGSVTLQEYRLADGSVCLKAFLAWAGSREETVHPIYETPETLWATEARRIAATWLAGMEASAEAARAAAGGVEAAAG